VFAAGGIVLFQLVALAAAGVPSPLGPIPVRIDYDAPVECPHVEMFYAGVQARTERVRLAEKGEVGLRLGVRLTRSGAFQDQPRRIT